ncbi:MAG TPA: PQQ-binding-like beta-propeller repeat protein [Novosphingobium sp.]
MTVGKLLRGAGRAIYGLLLIAVGSALALGGAKLASLGGSLYYLPAGLAAIAAGVFVLTGRWRIGAAIYLVLILASLAWGLWEAGLDGWALAPRVLSPFVLGIPFLCAALIGGPRSPRLAALACLAGAAILVAAVWSTSGFTPARRGYTPVAATTGAPGDWTHFGNGLAGAHFSPLADIDRTNVAKLKVAWSVPIDDIPLKPIGRNQAQPLKVGDHLYVCTPSSDVLDIEPETGRIHWKHEAHLVGAGILSSKCRGVAYYEIPGAAGICAKRIYSATMDGRLFAMDAESGRPCADFGNGGTVNLLEGLSQRNNGYYGVSSAPLVTRGKVVVGGSVADGQYVGEPSGVVRAFDAISGRLAWAWDVDKPAPAAAPFSPGTPNSWGPMSADEALGLIYAPTGNGTPDYWSGHRSAESLRYASSVVALDAETGQPRWSFQTTHRDVWDYDVGSQPVLFDWRGPSGVVIPALLQPTKRGQLFVLDRRTGKPLFPVAERPAPRRGAVEKLSPTQPWSVALPSLAAPRVVERDMWGLSALDQLWCRIKFHESRYDGPLTPPGLSYSLSDPGYLGGVNWGSASIDGDRQLAFLLNNRIVNRIRLLPRSDPAAQALKASSDANLGGPVAQEGTPYAADIKQFLSPLGVPCQAPPHGMINAVDLRTGKLVWSRPLGSARDLGPMGMPSHLNFAIGTPLFGGSMSTAGGLVFVGGSQDHAFRAFDSETGRLLFEADLPGSSLARPMSFRSSRDGRQYIVVASEGPRKGRMGSAAITAFVLAR